VGNKEDGTLSRGDKLAPVRTLLASAGWLTPVALAALQVHALALCRPVRAEALVVRAGDLLLEARGWLDGAPGAHRKRQRQGDVILPLKAKRLAPQAAMQRAALADKWAAHPFRAAQRIAWVHGVEHRWPEGAVPLHACVIRFWTTQKKCTAQSVLVTTDLTLTAPWMVRHDAERPAIEQDDAQLHSGGWQLQKRSATRSRAIVLYVLTVVLRASLSHLLANTKRGARCADKTRQALVFEQLRPQRTHVIVDAGGHFALFETLRFVQLVLQLSPPVQERLRTWLVEHRNQMQKRE
jgi:hypothetical protein